ncbi:MAG: NUDIX domain-containing protein, partial [Pseudonocardia sp.]|nr:NUDIX domain-containing protein [Pseudonocardia sp.]
MTEGDGFIACVGGLAYDDAGRLLVVRRRDDPGRGLWSVPGGRVEAGESDAEALVREMAEETGLVVEPGELVGRVLRGRYAIADYRCAVVGGTVPARAHADDPRRGALTPHNGLPHVAPQLQTSLKKK